MADPITADGAGDSLIAHLIRIPKFGHGIGLHRMVWLRNQLPDPAWLVAQDTIRVTGSNGKGSTVRMLAAVLGALGVSRGMYISPHLIRFHERITVNDHPISDAELANAFSWFETARTKYIQSHPKDTFGAFEAFTALAMYHFSTSRPDVIIAEAGIGGRYDSTRVFPGQFVGLTSVDLEHTQLLGNTREQIAYDKADLCPAGGTLVAGFLDEDLLHRLDAYCRLRDVALVAASREAAIGHTDFTPRGMSVDIAVGDMSWSGLKIALQGGHQVENAVVAILLAWAWVQAHRPDIDPETFQGAVTRGLGAVTWTGRFERVQRDPAVYIDVGHTPDALYRLAETVRAVIGQPIVLVTGGSANKPVDEMLAITVPLASEVICTQAYHRGLAAEDVYALAQGLADGAVSCVPQIEEALLQAVSRAKTCGGVVLIAGGLFLAVEGMVALQGKDPRALRFF